MVLLLARYISYITRLYLASPSTMDRLSILQQKKQRLEELRQKRLASGGETKAAVEEVNNNKVLEDFKPKKIDIAIQVDGVVNKSKSAKETRYGDKFVEIDSLNKSVQTDKVTRKTEVEDTKKNEPPIHNDESTDPVIDIATHYNEQQLNILLNKAIILLHEALSHSAILSTNQSGKLNSMDDELLHEVFGNVTLLEGYRPNLVKTCPYNKNIVLVNFELSQNPLKLNSQSGMEFGFPGLAVIVNTANNKLIPIHFLACNFSICQISFDIFNESKIIGGLANGKVVIWELNEPLSEAFILPTLITPSSYKTKLSDSKQMHKSPITSILQFSSETNIFMTTCSEGTINIWSTNFLEHPQYDTIYIGKRDESSNPSILSKASYNIAYALITSSAGNELYANSNALSFLNSVMIITDNGNMVRLSNDPKQEYNYSLIDSNLKVDDFNKTIHSITELGVVNDNCVVASSHLDSTISLWNITKLKLLHSIQLNYIVIGLATRPSRSFQFVSYGLFDILSSPDKEMVAVIEFWDLSQDLRFPLYRTNIPVNNSGDGPKYPVSVEFDVSGTHLFLAFNDGLISVWDINEEVVKKEFINRDNIYEFLRNAKV